MNLLQAALRLECEEYRILYITLAHPSQLTACLYLVKHKKRNDDVMRPCLQFLQLKRPRWETPSSRPAWAT